MLPELTGETISGKIHWHWVPAISNTLHIPQRIIALLTTCHAEGRKGVAGKSKRIHGNAVYKGGKSETA